MFNTKSPNINIYYKPFPVISLKKFIDEEYYFKLVDTFPKRIIQSHDVIFKNSTI